ncbi:Phosphotriesterase homology protein [subsurface metagenome]
MDKKEIVGKAQTVLGAISPKELGVTLPHEHLIIDMTSWFIEPSEDTEKTMAHQPITLNILWWLHYHFNQNLDDNMLDDEKLAIGEVLRFRNAGGNSIVELTPINIARNPLALASISQATGLNIIMGSGYYTGFSMGAEVASKSEEEIVEEIVRDITEGVGNTGVRAGIIGEVGCTWPLTKNEMKSLRAAARAQQLTGAPLNIHPGDNEYAPDVIIRIVEDAGADISHTVISHIDRTVRNPENRSQLAKTGCYLEYDLFGREGYFPPQRRFIDLPNDHQRLNEITQLIGEGYLDQILISQDICTKQQLCAYGGWGYDHILRDVVPVMRLKGFSDEVIRTITVDNPKRLLTFV